MGAKLSIGIHEDGLGAARLLPNIPDVAAAIHVRACSPDTDYIGGRSNSASGVDAYGRVLATIRIIDQRTFTDGCVLRAVVNLKRKVTNSSVGTASRVIS